MIPVAISSSAALRAFKSGSASIVSGKAQPDVESVEKVFTSCWRSAGSVENWLSGISSTSVLAITLAVNFQVLG
jgi:hypothetical protein